MNDMLRMEIAAADKAGDLVKFSGVAYSGGKISQAWSPVPLVIDLAKIRFAPQIPLMYSHVNDPAFRLGMVEPKVEDGKLAISGGIDAQAPRAAAIVETGKRIPWQLSVGAALLKRKRVDAGEKLEINGVELEGPFDAAEVELREVSVVALGADADTELRIAAGWQIEAINNKENVMETPKNTPAVEPEKKVPARSEEDIRAEAVEAERKRVADVTAALSEYPTLVDKAVSAGWTLEHTQDVIATVKAATGGMTAAGPNVIVRSKPAATAEVLEAALSFRAGIDGREIEAAFGEQVTAQADKMRGISLAEAVVAACRLRGIEASVHLDAETIRAAFSTTDLPVLLGNVANKRMLKEFNLVPTVAPKLCTTGDLADYKEADRVRLVDIGDLAEIPAGGEVPNSQLGEETAKNQAKRYGRIFWIDEMLIVNDDLNAFLQIPRIFGNRAARKIDKVFFERLMANPTFTDGKALFHSAHKNLKTGSASALSLNSLKAARTALLQQVDANGDNIAVAPKYLLVPSGLEADAMELVASQGITTGENATKPTLNIVSKWGLEVIGAPQLDNPALANYSATAWYLFADPAQCDTFEIGYLRGQRNPVVKMVGYDPSRFGVGYRVEYSFGVREQEFRGMVKSTGAN